MLGEGIKDSEVRYKNPFEYEKYVKRHFECMKADGYQVKISERLYYRATKDKKIEQWLENNLTMLPYCMKSLSDIIAVTGGRIVSCICQMNNYNNISTEIRASDRFHEMELPDSRMACRSVIRTTTVSEIEEQIKYNSIFWTPEAESAGFKAKA
ncbi:MAG: hypothetical protein K2G51_14845 [Lachnospiraceae bacterium]|nr:hypothetical protein [Lachnospiraceae bacterium]MDE7272360.1 hypothetical protein [Lachnospiraceae bacterium]